MQWLGSDTLGLCRLGVARALLSACEAATKTMAPHLNELILHVRLANEEANALYASEGYETLVEDGMMARFGKTAPQRMMRKVL